MSSESTVAETIWEQMGGAKVGAMIGVKHRVASKDGVGIRFKARASNKANHVHIALTEGDVYTVTFFSIHGYTLDKVSEHTLVHAEDLKKVFTRETGLALSL